MERAARSLELPALGDCTEENLRELARRKGIDFATALFYDRVRRSPQHRPFIERIESPDAPPPRLDATVVIVPGAFYQQFPRSGADGRLVREQALMLGCRVELIPLPNFSSLAENAQIICDWLVSRTREPIVLVSLSKGGSDVKLALARPDAFRNVAVWINLSGILSGTPLVTWLFSDRLRSRWTRFLLRRRGYDLDIIRDLDRKPGTPLDFELRLPDHLCAIHVVGFPLRRHATNRLARRNHARLEVYGPNDGAGILLADACRWPGFLYPLWGADHYLRPAGLDIGRVAATVLRHGAHGLATEAVT
jgi:hypothetical protein